MNWGQFNLNILEIIKSVRKNSVPRSKRDQQRVNEYLKIPLHGN